MAKQTTATFTAGTPQLTISQCIDFICAVGSDVSVLVRGHMGSGKTSMGKEIARRMGMRLVYFDNTTKDLGDLFLPHIRDAEGADHVSFAPNEEFGIHLNEDIVLMIDEYGKNRATQNALNRVLQERCIGSRKLSDRSIIFATTNLGGENVGDMVQPHSRNRICIVDQLKPSHEEWIDWAMENGVVPELIVAVREIPQMLASFTDYTDPKENPYIYHPADTTRTSFVTPRSLEKASHVLKRRAILGDHVVTQGIMGLVGPKAAVDIMTMVNLGDTLPKYQDIADGKKVRIPESVGAQIMSAFGCLQRVEAKDFDNVFAYIKKLPLEVTLLFCFQLIKMPSKVTIASTQPAFTEFARNHGHLCIRQNS